MSEVKSNKYTSDRRHCSRRDFLKGAVSVAGLTALTACGGPSTPQTVEVEVTREIEKEIEVTREVEKEIEVTREVEKEAPPEGPVEIRFSSVGWGGWLSEPWMELVSRFNESQSAVQIPNGYEDVAEGYEKVMTQAAGAVAADVYMFETKYMQSFASLGFFVPLDDYVTVSPVVSEEKYFAQDWEEMFWGGRQMLAPFDNSPATIWYNKDIFDEAGVDYPPDQFGGWDWMGFLDTAIKLTQGEGAERIFGWTGERRWVYFLPWVWSNGGWILNEEKTKCVINMPETVEALQWAADLIHEHKIQPLAAELTQGGNSAMFYMGRAAMAQKGTWWAIDLKAQEGLNWNVAPMPDGAAGVWTRNPLDAWGVWNGSQHKDAAWQFVEFLSSYESLELLTLAGLSVSNKEVLSDVFTSQEPADVDWYLFVDALDSHVRRHPDTAIYLEMENLITPEWEAVLDGAKTPQEMVQALEDPINALLSECIEDGECEG
jgi:multiple sugar transport system substrate-binding protein